MPKHIVYISDLNMGGADSAADSVPRSGYANIAMELCRRLANLDYEVKILGIGYTGQEYDEKFSIIPCATLQDVIGNLNNIKHLWGVDAIIVALDIHFWQEQIFPLAKQLSLKYICITPLESDPLCITWANLLRQMDKVFFISQFGADEAIKAGVEAEHIEIGIDTIAWRLRTQGEYEQIRKSLGYDSDDFVILTVADNQERKNLGRGLQIVAELKKRGVSAKHLLVTREYSNVGWKLYDLAYDLKMPPEKFERGLAGYSATVSSDFRVFSNGIPFSDLYTLYCVADAYLCCSKGEGLGLPIMESMCVGIPVVANETGAIPELLENERGWIVDWFSFYPDPFGNQNRYDISIWDACDKLIELKENPQEVENRTKKARAYMESRSWEKPARQLRDAIEKITKVEDEQK